MDGLAVGMLMLVFLARFFAYLCHGNGLFWIVRDAGASYNKVIGYTPLPPSLPVRCAR